MSWANALTFITELPGFLASIAVLIGVYIGRQQLDSWRTQRVATQKSDLAVELIAHLSELKLSITDLRSPVGFWPPAGEEDDGAFDYRRRMKVLADLDSEFFALRKLKVRQRILIGDDETNQEIENFFSARHKLFVALAGLIRAYAGGTERGQRIDAAYEKRIPKYQDVIWEGAADEDEIEMMLTDALNRIENALIPIARLKR